MNYFLLGKVVVAIVLIVFSTLFLNRKYSFINFLISAAIVVCAFILGNACADLLTKVLPESFYESIPHLHGISDLLISVVLTVLFALGVKLVSNNKFIAWFKNEGVPKRVEYGKDEATALKGIAILILLFHHLFLKGRFEDFGVSFAPFPVEFITKIASYSKICVAIYAFISGYGLYLGYQNKKSSDIKWVAQRYLKTFSGFWLIVVLSWIVCQFINGRVSTQYFSKSPWAGIAYMILEFLGLSDLFGTPSICGSWWYMSAAFVFIVLTPLVARAKNSIAIACLITMLCVRVLFGGDLSAYLDEYMSFSKPLAFVMPFLIGAIFAKNNLIIKIVNARHRWLRLILELSLLVFFFVSYIKIPSLAFYDIKMGVFGLPVILICIEYIIPRKGIHPVFVFLGKHSMNIFLVHTFIRRTYLEDFTYSFPHFTIIIVVLLLLSLSISLVLEWIKKTLHYNEFFNNCLR